MLQQQNLKSFFNFLGRNKLYTTINVFGLSVSLMFVILIADYTLHQFSTDNFHTKADRIRIISGEHSPNSGYYLQKYLLDRYPEIESTCAVTCSGWSMADFESVQVGEQKYAATTLYADTTFFRLFDFPIVAGDRTQALAARNNVVLSESFARKVFGTFNPLGQTLQIGVYEEGKPTSFIVSAVMKDIDNSAIPNCDILLRAERLMETNSTNDEQMSNAGSVTTFLLVREGADLDAKIPDILSYFKEIYWPYKGNTASQVLLLPLKTFYFSDLAAESMLQHGSRSFVLILLVVGLVILFFAVLNYINLTVAQTGFRAREMAMRRLLGSSRGEVIFKLILESTLLCAGAFLIALAVAGAVEPYAEQLLESKLDVIGNIRPATVAAYVLLIALLGTLSGIIPALIIARFKPLDVVAGTLRRKTKMVYSNVLITLQNIITIVLIAVSLTILLQIRHMINAPLGYDTHDVLEIQTELFKDYSQVQRFRNELQQEPAVEQVALSRGLPLSRGNNITMQYGPDRMVSFQVFIGDSAYFRMFDFQVLRDNHAGEEAWLFNEYALRVLSLTADTTNIKMGPNYDWNFTVGGIVRDFQIGSAIDQPSPAMMRNIHDFDRYYKDGEFTSNPPWSVFVRTRGDRESAYNAVKATYERITSEGLFRGEYIDQQISASYAEQQRLLRIVAIFTLIAVLISALGLLAISTYYIQQKQQEIAVRKVFGATRREVLVRLVSHFMRLVGVAFVAAVPIAWYITSRWLEEYSVRIVLSPLIFAAAGIFAGIVALVVVFWQSRRAADTNPVKLIKR